MGDRFHVATRKGLFTIVKGTGGWKIDAASLLGENVSMVFVDPRHDAVYAALEHGHFGVKLHRSKDGALSFEECATPEFPEKPEDVEDKDGFGNVVPWTVKRIWALEGAGPDRPYGLWCGTIPGGLFRSTDGASSWELVRSLWDHPGRKDWFGGGADLPGIHTILVDPRRSDRVLLGVSCGGVWITEDAGETWACRADGMRAEYMPSERARDPGIQDPHRVALCREAPDQLWVQHHNGIFRSTDGSTSWTEIEGVEPSAFGFAVAVHPRDPATAWFVPAVKDEERIPVDGRVIVTRTRDGGATFQVLTQGLPQSHAYDLVYRHALDVDDTGNVLAFGSTTGSVWVSEDQGDSWEQITAHLPPVYAVRFCG